MPANKPAFFRVDIRTKDPELAEALKAARNRARLVKLALKHFLSTERGKEAVFLMSKPLSARKPTRKKKEIFNFDAFLSGKPARPGGAGPSGKKKEEDGFDSGRFL